MPSINYRRKSLLSLSLALFVATGALPSCDLGELPDDIAIGNWRRLLCDARIDTWDTGLALRADLIRDCNFRDGDSIFDWDIEPAGFPGENEVTVEFDDESDLELEDRLPPIPWSGSARVANLKRNLTSPYGAMVQCHYASDDFHYAASGAILIRDQRVQGVPQRFLAYVELTFYEHDDCFGTSIDGRHASNYVVHPQPAEIWRSVSTGAVPAPEGTRSVKIGAVVDVPSGNPIGQSYEANFDLLTLAVLEEDLAPVPF